MKYYKEAKQKVLDNSEIAAVPLFNCSIALFTMLMLVSIVSILRNTGVIV